MAESKATLNFDNLEAQLMELKAADFMAAERECRMAADPTPDISQSTGFAARLAARAVGAKYDEVKALSLQEFFAVTMRVKAFLLKPLGEKIISENS
ncbi:hypothetical protein [Selenomonas bovis]|uniref:hypothetical protein n=1 Tax=Selenomonas bovis TaxID=416586 RepID=UPI0004E13459|nr:hypothetical protein [Selenomonas bovis]